MIPPICCFDRCDLPPTQGRHRNILQKTLFLGLLIPSLLLNYPADCRAELAGKFSGVLAFSSTYFYRGYSKSNNDPTARGNLDWEHDSGVYLGSWISRVDFGDTSSPDRSNVEFYPYAGFNYALTPDWRIDANFARYIYDGKIFGQKSDYNEYSLSINFKDLLTGSVAFTDSYYGRGQTATNIEIKGRYPLASRLELSGGVGYNQALRTVEYDTLFWNAGMVWYFYDHLALDLRYVDYAFTKTAVGDHEAIEVPYISNYYLFSLSAGF